MAYLLTNPEFEKKHQIYPIWDIIEERIKSKTIESLLIIVPTSKLSNYYKTDIIRKYVAEHKTPISSLNVLSYNKFVKILSDKLLATNKNTKYISDGYALSIFEEAVEKAGLKFFLKKSISSSLLKRLFNVIMGLRQDGINSAKMRDNLQSLYGVEEAESQIAKMEDMQKIMESYEQSLSDKYLDTSGILGSVLQKLPSDQKFNINDFFPGVDLILLNEFSEFRVPEAELLSKIANSDTAIAIHLDYSLQDGPLLGGFETTILNLANQGYSIKEITTPSHENEHAKFLRKHLFQHRGFKDKTDLFNNSIRVISTKNRLDEVKYIGKLVKYLNIDKGIELKDIAICSRQPDLYANLFREIFFQYNIPNNVTDRILLNSSPLVIGIFAIFDVILHKFRSQDIKRVFNLEYFRELPADALAPAENTLDDNNTPIDNDNNTPNVIANNTIDIDNILSVTNLLRLSSGFRLGTFDDWLSKFDIAIQTRADAIKQAEIEDDSGLEKMNLQADIKRISKAKKDLEIIHNLFSIKPKLKAREFANWIRKNIIQRFNLEQKIINKYDQISQKFPAQTTTENLMQSENLERESQALFALILAINELEYIYSDRFGDETFPLQDLVSMFKTSVEGRKYQIREKKNYGVTITSIEQLRGIPFKVTILCGMIDGEFPLRYNPEIFLGVEIPETEIKHNINERMIYYQFLMNNNKAYSNNEKQVFLTFPEKEDKNTLVQSPFIDFLLNITNLEAANRVYSTLSKSGINDSDAPLDYVAEIDSIRASFIEISEDMLVDDFEKDKRLHEKLQKAFVYSENFNHYSVNNTSQDNIKINRDSLPAEIREFLDKAKDKVYSATEFDNYASCGLKYMFDRILKLRLPEELELTLSSLEMGTLIHRILYRFYQELRTIQYDKAKVIAKHEHDEKKDIFLINLDISKRNSYLDQLNRIAGEEIDKIKFSHPFFDIGLEKIVGSNNNKGLLEIWLDAELEKNTEPLKNNNKWLFKPALFELDFGNANNNTNQKYIELRNGLKLRGKIDRIEFKEDGSNLHYLIADYKRDANKQAKINAIGAGKAFQIGLYLAAAEEYLKANYPSATNSLNFVPSAGVYYAYEVFKKKSSNNPRGTHITVAADDSGMANSYNKWDNGISELIGDVVDKANDNRVKISDGFFPLTENSIQVYPCKYCSYMTICRIKDNKTETECASVETSEESSEE